MRILLIFLLLSFSANANSDRPFKYVVWMIADGLGGWCLDKNPQIAPYLTSIKDQGSWTNNGRATKGRSPIILGPMSGPNWASLLTGTKTKNHKIETNQIASHSHRHLTPTIFWAFKKQFPEKRVIYIAEWDALAQGNLIEKDIFNENDFYKMMSNPEKIKEQYLEELKKDPKPTISFIGWNNPDSELHGKGFCSEEYKQSTTRIDSYIKEIVNQVNNDPKMSGNTLFVLTSDHGGTPLKLKNKFGKYKGLPVLQHGASMLSWETKIPIYIWGNGDVVKKGVELGKLKNYQITPTISRALNLRDLPEFKGELIKKAFHNLPISNNPLPHPTIHASLGKSKERAFFFTGPNYTEYDFDKLDMFYLGRGRVLDGYPKENKDYFKKRNPTDFPSSNRIDAAMKFGSIEFYFQGDKVFSLLSDVDNYTSEQKSISEIFPGLGDGNNFESDLSCAFSYKDKIFLFKGSDYIKYNFESKRVEPGYPRPIKLGWPGLDFGGHLGASHLDACFYSKYMKRAYFFKDQKYIGYDMKKSKAKKGFPKMISSETWEGHFLRNPYSKDFLEKGIFKIKFSQLGDNEPKASFCLGGTKKDEVLLDGCRAYSSLTHWKFKYVGDGSYQISPNAMEYKCLKLNPGQDTPPLSLTRCSKNGIPPNQKFLFDWGGNLKAFLAEESWCLTQDLNNGQNIVKKKNTLENCRSTRVLPIKKR